MAVKRLPILFLLIVLPAAAQFDAALVAKGSRLAAIGNCRGCHTAPDGAPLAGGLPIHAPVGTIYTTNITPDPETGIGQWSREDFMRAMRKGVSRDGHNLYPAFPYDRFTELTDEDIGALYAWAMSQAPVRFVPPRNELAFPFNIRAGIGLWKSAYLHEGPRPATSGNPRGEYLVESLGHCGSCHSPRNWAYAEERNRAYAGGDADGWHAYSIDASNKAARPWDAASLSFYLRHGFDPAHGVSRGTMGLVTAELADADPADVDAMAAYVADLMRGSVRSPWSDAVARAPLAPKGALVEGEGAAIYRDTCVECHDGSRALPFGGIPLSWSSGIAGESPRNLINVILHGLPAAGDGETTPAMPGYAGALSDAQVQALVEWLRANLSDQPAWHDVPSLIVESRKMTPAMLPPGGKGTDP
jgi:mono/diheme cytochrome c family protein